MMVDDLNLHEIIDGIVDHLPLYPKVDKHLGFELFKRKELNELVLDPTEAVSNVSGKPLAHQEIESRIFSPATPYDRCIFWHQMGTGKTCLTSFIFENAKKFVLSTMSGIPMKKALIVVPNKAIMNNFIVDIESKCTSGVYSALGMSKKTLPSFMGGKGTKTSRQRRMEEISRRVRESYEFTTVASFARNEIDIKLDNSSYRDDFIEHHSNRYIIIDEAHHLKGTNPKYAGLYKSYHRFFHSLNGSSIFLLTGTPVVDDISEIASLLNLVNDLEHQLPEGGGFTKKYFTKKDGVLVIKDALRDELKSYMWGKMSVLRSIESTTRKVEIGRDLSSPENVLPPRTSLYFDVLSPEHYAFMKRYVTFKKTSKKVSKKSTKVTTAKPDTGILEDTARKGEMDAIGFMFIDSTKKFCKNCELDSHGVCLRFFENHITLKGKRYEYVQKGLGEYIRSNLDLMSSKFASVIHNIIERPTEKVYVYNELIRGIVGYGGGGGIINFGLVLEAFGYVWITPGMVNSIGADRTRRRFAIISSDEGTFHQPAQRNALIDKQDGKFNIKDNSHGDYCQVIIGSQAIAEGINLYAVRQMHVMYAHWNRPGTQQAESRADRYGSHDGLPEDERYLQFYHHASVAPGKDFKITDTTPTAKSTKNVIYGYLKGMTFSATFETVDIVVYQAGYRKYYPVAQLKRLAKEASVDCIFTYRRNVLSRDVDGSAECDYQECNYVCDGTPDKNVLTVERVWEYVLRSEDDINTRSAVGLYSKKDVDTTIPRIRALFMSYDSITLSGIEGLLLDDTSDVDATTDDNQYQRKILLKSLHMMIAEYHQMRNKYGVTCYLKEKGNVFYLSYKRFQNRIGNLEDTRLIRGKYPTTLSEMMATDRLQDASDVLTTLCKHPTEEAFDQVDPFISTDVVETVLCCLRNDSLTKIVKETYRGKIFTFGDGASGGIFHTISASDEYIKNLLKTARSNRRPVSVITLVLKNMKKYMKAEGIRIPVLTDREQLSSITGMVPKSENEMLLEKYSAVLEEYSIAGGIPNLVTELRAIPSFKSQIRVYLNSQKWWKWVDDPILEHTLAIVLRDAPDETVDLLAEAGIDPSEIYGIVGPRSKIFWVMLKKAKDGRTRSGRMCYTIPLDTLYKVLAEIDSLPEALTAIISQHANKTIAQLETLVSSQKGRSYVRLFEHFRDKKLPEKEYRKKLYSLISLLSYKIDEFCTFIHAELARKGKILRIEKSGKSK